MTSVEGQLILFSGQTQPLSYFDMHDSIICVQMGGTDFNGKQSHTTYRSAADPYQTFALAISHLVENKAMLISLYRSTNWYKIGRHRGEYKYKERSILVYGQGRTSSLAIWIFRNFNPKLVHLCGGCAHC